MRAASARPKKPTPKKITGKRPATKKRIASKAKPKPKLRPKPKKRRSQPHRPVVRPKKQKPRKRSTKKVPAAKKPPTPTTSRRGKTSLKKPPTPGAKPLRRKRPSGKRKIPERRKAPTKRVAIALPREIQFQKLLAYRRKLIARGAIHPPNGGTFNGAWWTKGQNLVGRHVNVRIRLAVTEENAEEIFYRIMKAADEARRSLPGGTLYAAIMFLEYGSALWGSPGEMFFEDDEGFYFMSLGGIPGSTYPQFAARVRREIENILDHSRSVVWIEQVTVRAYVKVESKKGKP